MPFKAFDFTEMSAMGHWCSSMAVNGAVSVHQWQESEATASMQNASSPPSSCDHAPGIRTQHHKAVDDHAAAIDSFAEAGSLESQAGKFSFIQN